MLIYNTFVCLLYYNIYICMYPTEIAVVLFDWCFVFDVRNKKKSTSLSHILYSSMRYEGFGKTNMEMEN